jgi:hypothetical protein
MLLPAPFAERQPLLEAGAQRTLEAIRPKPTLLNATSKGPYISTVFRTIVATSPASVTSALMKHPSPPRSFNICTVYSPPAVEISAITTFAPSRAKATADARPMPEPPPVTNTTWRLKLSAITHSNE